MNIDIGEMDSDDCKVALEAAVAMARRFRTDMVIMPDLSVCRLQDCNSPPLEIIRFNELGDE